MSKEEFYNSEYWENRIANETWKTYNNMEERNRALIDMYDKTAGAIKKELYTLAEISEENGGLTRTQQYRFNKLLGQRGYIFTEVEKLGRKVNKHATELMYEAGKSVYGNIMDALGVEDFKLPSKKIMEQMLRSPWHGSFFSERLWRDTGKLERNLNSIINDGVSTGKTVTEMAVQLSNIMNKSFNSAHMLVRTETINYMNRSALKGYEDAGVTHVRWWAAKDERTCPVCGTNHDTLYKIDKAPILPCHPGCRCTWLPEYDPAIKKIDIKDVKNNKTASQNEKLNQYANESLKIKKVDFNNLDYKATQGLLNTIADVYNKFPELTYSIKEIRQSNRATMAVGLNGASNKFTLLINSNIFGNPEKAQKSIERTIQMGLFAKGTTVKTIPYHEVGHMLEGVYIHNNYPKDKQEKAWDDCLAAKDILIKASIQCYNDENKYKKVIHEISSYAEETPSEGLAECIHLELTDRGNGFTHTVLNMLRGIKDE